MSPRNQDQRPPLRPLLYNRKQASQLLGDISEHKLKQLEQAGDLIPVRLNKHSATAQVFYTHKNLVKLARGDAKGARGD
jgi:hypothetical protein